MHRNHELSNHGPVRTQHDMSPEEIQAIEEKYGAKVLMDRVQEKRSPDDSYVYDSWHRFRYRARLKAA